MRRLRTKSRRDHFSESSKLETGTGLIHRPRRSAADRKALHELRGRARAERMRALAEGMLRIERGEAVQPAQRRSMLSWLR